LEREGVYYDQIKNKMIFSYEAPCPYSFIIPEATHLFGNPIKLEEIAKATKC